MPDRKTIRNLRAALLLVGLAFCSQGCHTLPTMPAQAPADVPRELAMQTLPPYVVEPPDVLLIEVHRWDVDKENGKVLRKSDPLALRPQPISGQHLVGPDGTVKLGVYGSVQVTGLTLDQIRDNIKGFLGQWFGDTPEAFLVVVDVAAYNSKSYFVITDGAGYGAQMYQFPITGNENVMKALTQIQGLPAVASKHEIWVARRSPCGAGCNPEQCMDHVFPVNWCAMTMYGDTSTNYQLMPGDRLFVMSQKIIAADNWLGKVLAPAERVLGITLLGSEAVNSIKTGTIP
jgi:polysaccharide export outer membrane protein